MSQSNTAIDITCDSVNMIKNLGFMMMSLLIPEIVLYPVHVVNVIYRALEIYRKRG